MAEHKLKPGTESVAEFLDKVSEPRRAESAALVKMMKRVSKTEPKIWAGSIVGFGNYHYKYESGHEGDCFVAGFAPRKTAMTLYITAGVARFPKLLAKLGKHKTGKGCLYIKNLDDVNLSVLEDLLGQSVAWTEKAYKR